MTGAAGNIPATLDNLTVPIGDVRPRRGNPRQGNVDLIAESLARNGQYRPIVVNKPTGEVLAGAPELPTPTRVTDCPRSCYSAVSSTREGRPHGPIAAGYLTLQCGQLRSHEHDRGGPSRPAWLGGPDGDRLPLAMG